MFRSVAVLSFGLCLLSPLGLANKKDARIYIDRMSGFEEVLASVAGELGVPGVLLDLPEAPHYRISQAPRFRNRNEWKFYYIATGRTDDMVLDFWDTHTRKSLFTYSHRMTHDERGQRRVAREFLLQVRRRLSR